jgi:hypothetical protein
VELKLLASAAQLLQGVVGASCAAAGLSGAVLGLPWVEEGASSSKGSTAAATTKGKGSTGSHGSTGGSSTAKSTGAHSPSKGGKAGTQEHGKGGAAAATSKGRQGQQPEQQCEEHTAAEEQRAAAAAELLAAQHQQLLVEALLQLVRVLSAQWLPLPALSVCLAACEAIKHAISCAGIQVIAWGDSSCDSRQARLKASLQPNSSTWLAARLQVRRSQDHSTSTNASFLPWPMACHHDECDCGVSKHTAKSLDWTCRC